MTGRRPGILLAAAALLLLAAPLRAQMQLPGANNGVALPGGSKPAGDSEGGEPRVLKPISMKPPSEDTIVGHALSLDGSKGTMTFDRSGSELVLTKLTLVGEKISKPGQACSIDVSMDTPLVAAETGHSAGPTRLDVPVSACPFSIEVLDGALLVSRPDPSCDFVAADCRITPGGLWGPTASEIGPKQVKDLERERVRIETNMRANFHALLKKAGKDRKAVKDIAREQAAFSSDREMICRDYQQESVHGYCSTRITEARALALLAKFGINEPHERKRTAAHGKKIVKPVPPAAATEPDPLAASDTQPR